MPRSGRKRKPVETLLDYEKFVELESEIKIEPTEIQVSDEASLLVPCCCLCKISSGDKLAVFGSGPDHDPDIASKIHSCLGLEISSEANPDAHICCGCLQQLESHVAFQKQVLKCNGYTQNQMTETGAEFRIHPEEVRVCRFCSKFCKKLLDMYPGGESPENDLLQKIRECLAIEVNSCDPVTKICRNCIQCIDDLLEFRTKHLQSFEYITDEIWNYGPSNPAKKIKQEDENASKQDLNLDLSVSDSYCSSEENEYTDPMCTGRQKRVAMRPELVQLIGVEVDGKNFTTLREDDEHMKVIFNEQLFQFHSEIKNGSSLWTCDKRKLRSCTVKLEIDATGRCAKLSGDGHTHPPGTAKLMQCPLGKGMTEMSGKVEPFYLFNSRSKTNCTRSLIHDGFRYFLHQIRGRGANSTWYCTHRKVMGCKAKLVCYGIFHKVTIDGEHNHGKLTQRDCETLLLQHKIDTMSTDAIDEFQNVNTVEMITEPWMPSPRQMSKRARAEMKSFVKEKNPQIFHLLKQGDVERNFEVIKTGRSFKVTQDKHEYRYYGELSDKCSVWRCIKQTLRTCKLLAKLTPDGKKLEIYTGKHSHGTEVEEIFQYPLGKRMIGEEPLWLLNRVSLHNDKRVVVYKDYLYNIANIKLKGEVRWSCHKRNCGVALSTKGNFEEVVLRNEHSHEAPSKSMITKLLNENTTSKVEADNLSLKQKLLSYPPTEKNIWDAGENEYETLYILTNLKKDARSGFIFRRHKFSFVSVDQNGTSKWQCLKRTDPDNASWGARCRVAATVEGLFETIVVAKQHAHEMMSDSTMEQIKSSIKQYVSPLNFCGEQVIKMEENPDYKRPTDSILSILTRHDPERNFTVTRAKAKLLVNYEGVDFRLQSRGSKDISIWRCNWVYICKCKVSLQMSADGKQVVYVDPRKQHNHADEKIGVFLQAPGKGQIYDKYRDIVSSYWLFSYQCEFRSNRGIIYQGYKYTLYRIQSNGASLWNCRHRCKMSVRVEGTFKVIIGKHEHNHARLTDDEIKEITEQEEVDTDLLSDCENTNAIIQIS